MGPPRASDLLDHVLREVPSVLDRLSDADKTSLAVTRWSTLEAVLRGCRAVLKVHLDDPVLQVLTRRMQEGPCRGEVATCGVRVAATDAGALLEAARELYRGLMPDVVSDKQERNLKWINLVWHLTCGAEDQDEARVTGLRMPDRSSSESETMELAAFQHILASRPAREHLRRLTWGVQNKFQPVYKGCIELLTASMRGLSALQHLELRSPPSCWVHFIGEYTRLATLELSYVTLSAHEMRALVDGLEQARQLRHLRLEYAGLIRDGDDGKERPYAVRAPPAGLQVLEIDGCRCPYDLREATNLHALELRDHEEQPPNWEWGEVAALMGRSEDLRRVTLNADGAHVEVDDVCAVFSALERSTVEVFDCDWTFEYDEEEEEEEALTDALASGLRSNRTLRDLALTFRAGPEDFFLDVPRVATALAGNTALRRLKLTSDAVIDSDVAAILEVSGRMRSLEELDVESACVTGKGWRTGLAKSYLQVLRLRGASSITDEGVHEIMSSMRDRSGRRQLHTVEISGRGITDKCAEHVAAALRHDECALRRLVMSDDYMGSLGDDSAAIIADALRQNCSLMSLYLCGSGMSDRGREKLAAALAKNTTLRYLNVPSACVQRSVLALPMLHAQRYAMGRRQMTLRGGL